MSNEQQTDNYTPAQRKIALKLKRYELTLRNEKKRFGCYDDSAGIRYALGGLYLQLGDVAGALKSYKWFSRTFPDDCGDPFDYLCWTLALYRNGDMKGAMRKLRQLMHMNLHLIPALIDVKKEPLTIQFGSSDEEESYLNYAPPGIIALWAEDELQWMKQTYLSPEFREIRERYIALEMKLDETNGVENRSPIVDELSRMRSE